MVTCRRAPNVPTRCGETVHGNNSAAFELWRLLGQNMKERESIGDVLNLNVIGNHVAFQTCPQRFAKLRLGIDQKTFAERGNEDVPVQFAFSIEHARFESDRFAGLAQIVCDLPVEKPEPVSPGHAKLRAGAEVEEGQVLHYKSVYIQKPAEKTQQAKILSRWRAKLRRLTNVTKSAQDARARGAKPSIFRSRFGALRHSCPDENRLNSCLRNPRRTGASAGVVALTVPVKPRKDSCDTSTPAS